jgi:hypothetical protein
VLTHGRNEVINTWLNERYGLYPIHLCKRAGTAFVVPVLLQEPVTFAVLRPLVAILTPILGMLVLPAVLAVALVGPVIGIGGEWRFLRLKLLLPSVHGLAAVGPSGGDTASGVACTRVARSGPAGFPHGDERLL